MMTKKELRLIIAVREKNDEELMECLDDMDVPEIRSFLLSLMEDVGEP